MSTSAASSFGKVFALLTTTRKYSDVMPTL